MNILIVEDEQSLLESLVAYLEPAGYSCTTASDFKTAFRKLDLYDYYCILVDLNLPDGDGLKLINHLKEDGSKAGIIIISARQSIDERIAGLEAGADDYLVKPFHLSELNARIQSVIRRLRFQGNKQVVFGDLVIEPEAHKVFANGEPVDLTRSEIELLLYLVSNQNKVVTRDSIGEHLWGDYLRETGSFDQVYTHIKNLRKKLLQAGCMDYIKTVYGVGYKFALE